MTMDFSAPSPRLATRFARSKREHYSSHAIGESDLARLAPSVFAESAHSSRSSRYAYIPTIEVLRGLVQHGFQPFYACEALARKEDKRGFTKHMLRLRHADHITTRDDVNEVIIINSHDGASSYQMLAGKFRFVCSNGLICGTAIDDVRVKHSGDVRAEVIDGAYSILSQFERVNAATDAFKSLQLTAPEQHAFARAALAVRYPIDTEGETVETREAPIDASQLLTARRYEDANDRSLWATFNTVQENAVNGGIRTRERTRRSHTRAVNGIDGNVNLNRALWRLAEEMRAIKVGN